MTRFGRILAHLSLRTLFWSLALLLASGIFAPVEAQFGNGYSYRREIDLVDAQVVGSHTNFPFLVSTTLADLSTTGNGGKVENDPNGYDIIFTSDQAGTTQLAHQIERYVPSTGEIVIWVRIESLVATTKIYMFYGNSGISSFQGDVTSNGVTGVWDSNFINVLHLNEDPSGTAPQMQDATANNNDGTSQGSMTLADLVDGKIGKGLDLDGVDGAGGDHISVADAASLDGTVDEATWSMWINWDNWGAEQVIIMAIADRFGTNDAYEWGAQAGSPDGNLFAYPWAGTGSVYNLNTATDFTNGTWHYMSVRYDWTSRTLTMNLDGNDLANSTENVNTTNWTQQSTIDVDWLWGGSPEVDTRFIDAQIDEIRVSDVSRSLNWIKTGYNNQDSPSTSYAMGAEETSAGTILLVVPDAGSLTAQDAAKKTLIESWGYTVALISANDTQANFDAAVATSDAVYVSEEVSSADVNTKLTSATIGIVLEEGALSDEIGFSSGELNYTDSAIDITDNTHYITSVFSTGSLTITSSAQPLHYLDGTIAAGAQVLAEQLATANRTLVVLDVGASLDPSGTAAGRRVFLPWGPGGWDINSLTVDGQTLMRRAIEWATGIGADSTPPDALTDLATGTVTASSVQLSWTAPGDDGATGTATTYDVRYSTSTITAGNWGSALQASGEPSPQVAGSSETFTVTGLSASTTYFFAIKTSDEVPNESAISNVPSTGTSGGGGTETYQQGDGQGSVSDTDDARLMAASPTTNYGSLDRLDVDDGGALHEHSVIKFPNIFGGGAFQIPLGSIITSATLTMDVTNVGDDMLVYQLIESWVESQVTWNDASTGVSWTNAGADGTGSHKAAAVGTLTGANGFNNVDVTASVQNWSDGEINQGWLLKDTGSDGVDLTASEDGTAALRPMLSVTYTAGGGDSTPPDAVADLATGVVTTSSVDLTWTAPGDDGASGTATTYDVRYSTSTITAGNWGSAFQASGEPSPQVAGSGESFTVTGLSASTTYFFAIKTSDEVPNESAISNVPSAATSASVGPGEWSGSVCSAVNPATSTLFGAVPDVTRDHNTTGTKRLMLVGISINNDVFEFVTGVTYNGVALTIVDSIATVDDARVEIWSLLAPSTGLHDVVVTFNTTLLRGGAVGVMTFTGVNQSTPLGPSATNANQSGTNATVDVVSAAAELVFGVVAAETPTSLTPGALQADRWNINNATRDYGAGSTEDGAPVVTTNWTLGSDDHWAVAGVSIKPANCDVTAPDAVTDLTTGTTTSSSIDLSWTAPGDDEATGTATTYDVRYSTSTIDDANWSSATQASGVPSPQVAGSSESFTVTGLSASTTYYFAIKTSDEVPNESAISNVPSAATTAPPPAALLARYWMEEEASGQAPTQLLDDQASPLNLPITYDGANYSYTVLSTGRGWESTTTDNQGRATTLVDGTKLQTTLDGATAATIEVVLAIDALNASQSRIFHIGDGSESGYFTLSSPNANTLYFYTLGTTLRGQWDPGFDGTRAIFHLVYDSSEPTAGDRVRLYKNGVLQAKTGGTDPPLNETISIPNGKYFAIANREVCCRSFDGGMYYAAIYDGALTASEVSTNYAALLISDDSHAPPTVAAAIPDTTVIEDSSPVINYRDLKAVFTDAEDGSALTFVIQSNTNPGLVTPTIAADSTLDLSFTASTTGTATITVRATDSGSLWVEDVFIVTVDPCPVATLPFTDDFNRGTTASVGNCWVEESEFGGADATINTNRLQLSSNNEANAPRISHTFTQVSTGSLKWTYVFNWDNAGEGTYELWMQLGNSATMVDPATSDNTGVAVNLKWASVNMGMTNDEGFGYVQGGAVFEVAVVSGGPSNDHTIEVIADLDLNTFTLKIDDVVQASGVAFDNNVNIDAVRIYTDELNTGNFTTSEFDDMTIEIVLDAAPPDAVTDLAAPTVTVSSVQLTWTAPGDDGATGTAATYDVRYSTSTITAGNWGSASEASGEPSPQVAGSAETFTVTGLSASTTYYFAIKTSDEVPNESAISNVPSGTTSVFGSLNVALVCGTVSCADVNLDVPLVNHLTSTLGHTVTNFGDADQAWTPTSYDVVVISESVGSSNNAWLKAQAVGILTVEGSNWDELEMGSAGGASDGADTQINITDNSHYITSVFPTGVLTVTTVTTNLGSMSGWANGVGKLAHYNSNSTLAKLLYVDNGGVLQGGVNTAAERRAFWGAQYFLNLTADGITIFNRALDWVAYNTAAPNTAPTVASAIADLRVLKDSSPIDNYRDLNAVFTDVEDGSALTFTIQSNTNSGLVTPTIGADSALDLSFTASSTGTATITIRATDSGALFVDDVFTVTVVQGFGYPTVGATRYTQQPDNKQGTKFTLSESAMADTLYFWAKLGGGASAPFEGTGVIYQDNAGAPGAWVATAQPAAVTGTLQWYASAFASPVPLSPGTYWLVVHHGSKIDLYGDAGTTNQRAYNADTYSDGPTDPFGAATQDDVKLGIYITYTVNSAPTVAAAIADTTVVENNPPIISYRDLKAVFTDVEEGSGLTFTIQSNTNSGLVTPSIIPGDSTLDLSFTASTSGTATITIRATDGGALFVDDVFTVTVTPAAGLLARYWMDEAPSGQVPTQLIDDQASPINLVITYDTPVEWTLDGSGHRGLGASGTGHGGIASASVAGTKFETNLDGATQATLVAVMEWGAGNADRMAGFMRSDGTRTLQMMTKSGGDLEFRYDGVIENPRMYWTGTWDDGVRRVFHLVYDSDDPTQDDRVRLYVDGVDQGTPTLISGAMPPLGDGLDFSDPTNVLAVLNEPDLSNGLPGSVFYYAVYTGEMTDAEITSDVAALLANDDNITLAVDVTLNGADSLRQLPSNGTPYSYKFTITNNSNTLEDFDLFGYPGDILSTFLTVDSIIGPNVTPGATPDSARIIGVPASSSDSAFVWYSVANAAANTLDSLYLDAQSLSDTGVSDPGWTFIEVVKPNLTTGKAVSPSGTQLPGTDLTYTVTITNDGSYDATGVVVTDSMAVELDFKVGSVVNNLPAGVGVVVEYSDDAGSTWTYVPVSAGCGAPATYDSCVTYIRWTLQNDLSYVGPDNIGTVEFVARIQ